MHLKNQIKDLKQLIDHPQEGDDFFHDEVDKFHAEREKVSHKEIYRYQKGVKSGFFHDEVDKFHAEREKVSHKEIYRYQKGVKSG